MSLVFDTSPRSVFVVRWVLDLNRFSKERGFTYEQKRSFRVKAPF